MKASCVRLYLCVGMLAGSAVAVAQTEFTYQGQLRQAGVPADGQYDLRFRLFNAAGPGGSPVTGFVFAPDVDVIGGLFTVQLDFGAGVFDGAPRWLEVEVRPAGGGAYTALSPRQPLTAVPYAMYAFGGPGGGDGFWSPSGGHIFNTNAGNVGVGTNTPLDKLHVRGEQATLRLEDNDDPGSFTELKDAQPTQLRINKTNSNGLVLLDLNPLPGDGTSSAVIRFFRETNTTGPKAVHFQRGNSTTQTSASIGVDGADSWLQFHGGNLGIGTSTPSAKVQVVGDGSGTLMRLTNGGSCASMTNTALIVSDVCGSGRPATFYGVTSHNLVPVQNDGSRGTARLVGDVSFSAGTVSIGTSTPVARLSVSTPNAIAVLGHSASSAGYGVYGESPGTSGVGVAGYCSSTTGSTLGVTGTVNSTSGRGVQGLSWAGSGVSHGVVGIAKSTSGRGVAGVAEAPTGSAVGVYGQTESTSGRGVWGFSFAQTGTTFGVQGTNSNPSGYGVFSSGNLGASGTKSFVIDHPADPENRYLRHYCTEGAEPLNAYSGVAVLDDNGVAQVELPDYFATINRDPRIQLTAVGAPMPMLHVAQEIDVDALAEGALAGPGRAVPVCTFRIAGGAPNAKVSWRVEAARNDPWVRAYGAPCEVAKTDAERGRYQHPELYGQPRHMGMYDHEAVTLVIPPDAGDAVAPDEDVQ